MDTCTLTKYIDTHRITRTHTHKLKVTADTTPTQADDHTATQYIDTHIELHINIYTHVQIHTMVMWTGNPY